MKFILTFNILLVESGILGSKIRNTAQGIRNPTNNWNLESKFYWPRLAFSTWIPGSTVWNPESKTVLGSLTWSNKKTTSTFMMPPLVSPWNDIWGTSAEIPYWWHVTTQIWVQCSAQHSNKKVQHTQNSPNCHWERLMTVREQAALDDCQK